MIEYVTFELRLPQTTSLEKEVGEYIIVFCKLRNEKSYLSSKRDMFVREID